MRVPETLPFSCSGGALVLANDSRSARHPVARFEVRYYFSEGLAISIPRTESGVIRHFQERMPYGLFVPDVP